MFITRYRALTATLLGWRARMWVSVKFKVLLLCASLKIGRRQLNSGAAGLVFLVSLTVGMGHVAKGRQSMEPGCHRMWWRNHEERSRAAPHRRAPGSCGLAFQIPFGRLLLRDTLTPCRSSKIVLIFEKFWHNKLCFFVSLLLLYL